MAEPSFLPTGRARSARQEEVPRAGYRRRKPLVSFEYGTSIYAPSEGECRFRVVATDAVGHRVFAKFTHRGRRAPSSPCWLLFDVGLDPAVVATLLGHANAAFTLSRHIGVPCDLGATVTAATEDR